jgi:signal transduction histidine kinase
VILNLALNAVEAMRGGGRLTLRTFSQPDTGGATITIGDTGEGIPDELLPNIFDPFFTTKEGGTGLGLAITYDIIQQHQGRITVESHPGEGTVFQIWLPFRPNPSLVKGGQAEREVMWRGSI